MRAASSPGAPSISKGGRVVVVVGIVVVVVVVDVDVVEVVVVGAADAHPTTVATTTDPATALINCFFVMGLAPSPRTGGHRKDGVQTPPNIPGEAFSTLHGNRRLRAIRETRTRCRGDLRSRKKSERV